MKYLKNRRTGVVFGYTDQLAKNTDMVPCDKDGKTGFEEVTADIAGTQQAQSQTPPDPSGGANVMDGPDQKDPGQTADAGGAGDKGKGSEPEPEPVMIGEKPLAKATKAEIIAFVKNATGIQIEDSLKVDEVREQAAKALAEADEE